MAVDGLSKTTEAAELTLASRFPRLAQAYRALREAASEEASALSPRDKMVAEVAWALASGSQNAVNAAVRRAQEQGLTPETLLAIAQWGIGVLGHSQFLKAFSWMLEALGEKPLYCSTCGIPIR